MFSAVLALIFKQLITILCILLLIALLLPGAALGGLISSAIPSDVSIMILSILISVVFLVLLMVFVVVAFRGATIAQSAAMVWCGSTALFTFANLARFYIFVVARIAQTTRNNFHQALAFHAYTYLPLLFHGSFLKSGAPLVPAALLFRQHQLENAGRVDKQNPLDWLRCLNAYSIALVEA